MPRNAKNSSNDEHAHRRVKLFLVLLVFLAVAGGAAAKFLQTTRGGVFLVDHGVESALPRVDREIGVALKRALEGVGLRRELRVHSEGDPAVWDIPCDEATDLLLVNVALTETVRSIGAVVRNSEQLDGGRTLDFRVGTHTRDTHLLTIRRLAPPVLAAQPPPPKTPKLAIVIDDFGYTDGGIAREFIDLGEPITLSILPELRHSADVLKLAKQRGLCVLLHLPMEPRRNYPKNLESITVAMSDAEIASVVGEYMESLPGIDGVSTHQGSRASADARVMRAVCRVLAGYDVFFLDSLTSPKSVAYNVAVEAGLRAATNSAFLDDHTERSDDVTTRLHALVETARKRGYAIGIGHAHPWTLEALRGFDEYLQANDVELVSLCDLIESEKR